MFCPCFFHLFSSADVTKNEHLEHKKRKPLKLEIEKVSILLERVFRNPRPGTIRGVMRRGHEETLTKLVCELPAKMQEIYRLKGWRIPPSFDPHLRANAKYVKVKM